jgi:hypothetical protein
MMSAVFMVDLLRAATFGIAFSKRRRKDGTIRIGSQTGPFVIFQFPGLSAAGASPVVCGAWNGRCHPHAAGLSGGGPNPMVMHGL